MSRTAYILKAYGEVKAVILAESQKELGLKTCRAIAVEEEADEKSVAVKLGEIGDWGEDTDILVEYINDGEKITNTDYSIMKCISY